MSEQQRIGGRYELGELIGRGGMGDVFRGVDTQTGRPVAIKLLHADIVASNPNLVDRFEREGQALRKLAHPNIVKVLATLEEDGRHYLVMEYVSGGSLRDLIDRESRMPVERVLNIALDLADALARAHRLNIIHRDIKPDNVLLAEDGTPRLTDFGVAHLGDRTRLTQTGAVIGTYAYLSPEACNGLELDERADIWSFGVMLYEMLAGRPPFYESSAAAVLTAILTKPAPDLTRLRDDLPVALVNLIHAMLEKDQDRRVPSVRMVGAELEVLIRGLDTPAREKLGVAGETGHSRFSTPPDEDDVPAMARRTPGQTHGLSLYPTPPDSTAGTPHTAAPSGTGASAPATASAFKWVTVMVGLIAVMMVAITAIIVLGGGADEGDHPESTIPPQPAALGAALIEPVASDEYMVLVAQLEQVGGEPRSVTRFIVDDLTQALEVSVPFSRIRIREYPQVITTAADAQAAAQANQATIVIWGNYDADLIEVEIQIGVLAAFPYNQFDLDTLARISNVRVHLTNARNESVAQYVLNVLSVLQDANGDAYEAMRTTAIAEQVTVTNAEVVGNTVAALTHQSSLALPNNTTRSIRLIDEALVLDPGNPILYSYRGLANERLGNISAARIDLETAQRLGPPDWTMPLMLLSSTSESLSEVMDYFDRVIALRPDDWFPLFFRGALYYQIGMFDSARTDLDRAIALEPNANFPYVYAALLALREGRIAEAAQHMSTILQQFPDPSFMNRLVAATFGEEMTSYYGVTLSAFGNMVLGRYEDVITTTATGLTLFGSSADLYLIRGFAFCALGDYRGAETSYTRGLSNDASYVLAYLMRAEVRLKQGDYSGAREDIAVINASPLADALAPLSEDVQAGRLGCNNFFSADNPLLQLTPEE
ncbi:MAG: protein kinase [Anaerolineae bacterium]|nr:protein kinase [Anaerolineae bacterium]